MGVRAASGPGDLQGHWYSEILARLGECVCIFAPLGPVEVDREEVAAVVFQQRIDPDRLLASQMAIEDRIRNGDQNPVSAVTARDARLLADSGAPFVGASRRISRFGGGLALPADRIHIRATAKQLPEQGNLLLGREARSSRSSMGASRVRHQDLRHTGRRWPSSPCLRHNGSIRFSRSSAMARNLGLFIAQGGSEALKVLDLM
jgi:hypothetical protein